MRWQMNRLIDLIRNHPDQINALAALCALFVSFLSIVLTVLTLRLQRIHNFKSLTPIASIIIGDYEDKLEVAVRNDGVGPLVVERLVVSDGNQGKGDLISWMPQTPDGIYWSTFTAHNEGRCISPNNNLVLIELEGDPTDHEFASFRDTVRHTLSGLTVTVEYKDIYDRRMPPNQRPLKWFARNLIELSRLNTKEVE